MRSWTERRIQRYIEEGRGSGEKENYIPWLKVEDLPKNFDDYWGIWRSSWKNDRMHFIFTDLAVRYFCMLEWDDKVIDVREHYPLEREVTSAIAASEDIPHLQCPVDKTPIFMTSTYLVTRIVDGSTVLEAIDTIYKEELKSNKAKQQLKIKNIYWELKGVKHKVITEEHINYPLSDNVYSLRSYRILSNLKLIQNLCYTILDKLRALKWKLSNLNGKDSLWTDDYKQVIFRKKDVDLDIYDFANNVARETGIDVGTIKDHIYYLIANKIIEWNASHKVSTLQTIKISDFSIPEEDNFEFLLNDKDEYVLIKLRKSETVYI